MKRNSGKKESSVENSERSMIGTFHELLLFLKMEPKIGCLLKMELLRQKMDGMALGWNSLPIRSKGVASWVKSRRNFSSISVIIYADESQLSDEKMGTKMALHHDDMI